MKISSFTLLHPEYGPLSCQVPFSLYQTLLDHHKIPDPYVGCNEKELTALSEKDYSFESRFTLASEDMKPYALLRFQGIDTLADVFLNGTWVGETQNMHRIYTFDVRSLLQEGENILRLDFHSPLNYIAKEQQRHYTWGQSGTSEGFGHIRKASSMFGWDWAPTLPDMGVYRPIDLLLFDTDRLEDVFVRQFHTAKEPGRPAEKVTITLQVTTLHRAPGTKAIAHLVHPDGKEESLPLTLGKDGFQGSFTVTDPKLWYVRGYGKQPLYTLTVDLCKEEVLLDQEVKRLGLRTLTVSTKDDAYGKDFAFINNGMKIFAMGADYVPEDSLLSRIHPERTRKLLTECANCNFNAIRVWGGGYYPSDEFYDICDELGLVVWQDFMFACVNIRLYQKIKENLKEEFLCQLKRLRHHASLGLFSGNNEMETAIMHWDGCKDSLLAKSDYLELYERMLPDLCDTYAPDTFYWPSSPSSGGGFDHPDDENRGDAHYWGAWHGSIPFESYRQYYFRFLSEFGFEAFPNIKTIRSFASREDENPFSPVMEHHQKCLSGNTKILTYLSDKYLYPYTFEDLVYASQLLQLDAIRYGVEHFRRFRGRCNGTIYWQLNDCWPVASWSSIDYYGRYKALMYGARRFYAPVLLSAHEKGFNVVLNLSNERPEPFMGKVIYRVIDAFLHCYQTKELSVQVPALTATDIASLDLSKEIQGHEKDRLLAYELYDQEGSLLSASSLLFEKPKAFSFKDPGLTITFKPTADPCLFTASIQAVNYAKCVEVDFDTLDASLSDNYFDLTFPEGKEITLRFETPVSLEEANQHCRIRSVYNIGRKD